jgi:branched-chain amino acid transport system ATP-binding protein
VSDAISPILQVDALEAGYGESRVLHGIEFAVMPGEVVTLLGRNGAGKTTTLRAIIGILRSRTGSIRIDGTETIHLRSNSIAKLGVGYCPEERGIFASLSVIENLLLPPVVKSGGLPLHKIFELFPRLNERRDNQGTKLSGGEQQLLAIARILRTGSTILLLDEPTEGLAPVIVQQIREITQTLRTYGLTVILVEQNFHFASSVADRHYVVERGRIVDVIPNFEAERDIKKIESYLGL